MTVVGFEPTNPKDGILSATHLTALQYCLTSSSTAYMCGVIFK